MRHIVRLVVLVCAGAIALLGSGAAGASAETVEVLDEASGVHCPSVAVGADHVITGGCPIHFIADNGQQTFKHQATGGEVVTSSCTSSFTARINEDGLGYIGSITYVGTGCTIAACDEPAPSHRNLEWPIALVETGPSALALLMTLCIRPGPVGEGELNTNCTLLLPVTQTGHGLEISATEDPCFENEINELTVHWISDSVFDEVEVVHTP
jgi:hypothetical protein